MITLADDVTFTPTESGGVLLNQRTGTYWMTNDTGASILRGLLDHGRPETAVAELAAKYPEVEVGRLSQDVHELIESLAGKGLLTL